MKNYISAITEIIDAMDDSEKISLHNEYCSETNNMDDYIYSMDEFDEIMDGMKPWEIARAAYYSGKFCPAHDYFWFNGYGNLESDDFCPSIIYPSDIADYIVRNDDDMGNDEIREVLDEMNDESESV